MVTDPNQSFVKTPLIEAVGLRSYAAFQKRVLDLLIVVMIALPAALIVAVLAVYIWLTTKASPFYSQDRIGRGGDIFRMWKLRSMVVNADEKLEAYLVSNPAARREWDLNQKLKNDPRITKIGKFIRKTSLDEVPQFWNVFIGNMSLVGPRPMMRNQRDLYPGRAYYALLPGITGFWQTSDRNECSFAERAFFDNQYYKELSFVTDVQILLKTVQVVLKPTGI